MTMSNSLNNQDLNKNLKKKNSTYILLSIA